MQEGEQGAKERRAGARGRAESGRAVKGAESGCKRESGERRAVKGNGE